MISLNISYLAGFSPHEAHSHQSFFAWILPTIRTSEFAILQIVGLDAAVVSYIGIPSLHPEALPGRLLSGLASQLPQDVLLLVFNLLDPRHGCTYARQLARERKGGWWIS